jgi:D-alanine-D-alanine ligase-like ATP-grasp enzyme
LNFKVKTEAELPIAIEVAYQDNEIIIESFLDGTEVSVGVINYKGVITVLPITEIVSEMISTMKLNILVNHKKSPQREF